MQMNTKDGHLWYKMVSKLHGKAVIYLMGVTRIHLGDGQVDCKMLIMIIIKEEGLLQKVESSAKNVASLSIYVGPILYSNNSIVSGVLFLFYKLDDEHYSRALFCWHWAGRMLTAVSNKV